MGGVEPAWDYIRTALENGKHIVTANKELLAKKGEELFNLSEKYNRVVLYEAAIAGGIPIIMPIKTILSGNKINKIQAILNGTTNYILTKMDADGASYEDVLKEAQALGYAEADPSGDVEGFDAAYKITTLATIAFNSRVKFENVYAKVRDFAIKAYREHEEKTVSFYNSVAQQYNLEHVMEEPFSSDNVMRNLEKEVLLRVVDNKWIDHLHNIDMLKEGIGLRAYGQKDPLIEYKKEAYDLFNKMMAEIQSNTVRYIFRAKFGIQFVSDDGVEVIE